MNDSAVRPFRRAFARFIDYLLWGMLTIAVLGEKSGSIHFQSRAFYLSFWIYPFFEAVLIAVFGTTFGKRLAGVHVSDENGNRLTLPVSLKRAFLVFGAGMGCFLSYVSLLFPVLGCYGLVKYKMTVWDRYAPASVSVEKTTPADKFILAVFMAFLASGYVMTFRSLTPPSPDFSFVEDMFASAYSEEIRPVMLDVLSEDTLLYPDRVAAAEQAMQTVQKMIDRENLSFMRIHNNIQENINVMPFGPLRRRYQRALNVVTDKVGSFLFTKSIRVSLFENILGFFRSAEGKYQIVDGRPVFTDKELARQYQTYLMQLDLFLSEGMPVSETLLIIRD